MSQSSIPQINYGFSENSHFHCMVEHNQEEFYTYWKQKPISLLSLPRENRRFIKAIPHHLIWRKVFYLPKNCTQTVIYQQIIQHLNQALPIPLTEIQFDYYIKSMDNRIRIALFAVRKNMSNIFNISENIILDCELHCIARALHYLNSIPMEQASKYCYPFEGKYFQFSQDGLILSETQPEGTHLVSIKSPQFDNKMEEKYLYLRALGAALWNGKVLI